MTEGPAMRSYPLGESGWRLWADGELRSAGFPASVATVLADEELAGAEPGTIRDAYARAASRVSARLAEVAATPLFREAVAWQNPHLLAACLDKVARPGESSSRPGIRRRRELTVAKYLQRYTLKNDTIGFFGPLGFATLSDSQSLADLRPGSGLTSARQVFFEQWAIDALARAIAEDPLVRPWLRPRTSEAVMIDGGMLLGPGANRTALTAAEQDLLNLCDGSHTIADLARAAAGNAAEILTAIDKWCAARVVTVEFDLPYGPLPEMRLQREISAIPDSAARNRALATVNEVIAARDAVARCAGDAERLVSAMARLDEVFERSAGQSAQQRAGEAYGARRVIYEDTLRDVTATFGQPLRDALAAPLTLLLDSARWLVAEIAQAYRDRFDQVFDMLRTVNNDEEVEFPRFFNAITPDLAYSFHELPPVVAGRLPEFQRRWSALLKVPADGSCHHVRCQDIAEAAGAAFPAADIPWSSACHHSPDIMIAARSATALNDGDFLLILGELHLAMNTVDCPATVQSYPDSSRALAADAGDRNRRRVLPVPAKASSSVNSRTFPPALVTPQYLYWTLDTRNTGAPAQVWPGAGMRVARRSDQLIVRCAGSDEEVGLLDVLGEYLSAAVMNAFRPVAAGRHRPRVTLDRLVIARESWTFAIAELSWALINDQARAYSAAREWQAAACLPRRAFYRVAVEEKPIFIDFASIHLVRILAMAVRRCIDEEPDSTVTLTEMLPDIDQHWLPDASGETYACELRLVATDRSQRDA